MSDYIKYMYREYLEGRTRIKKVNEDQPLFPNTGAGLLIQKNKLTDDWTALNVSDGHYEEESFNHEALAAAFLQGANMGQLRMLIAAESIRMETVLKAADFNRLDKTKVSMLIESVYVHKRDPKSGTQAIDITWKF